MRCPQQGQSRIDPTGSGRARGVGQAAGLVPALVCLGRASEDGSEGAGNACPLQDGIELLASLAPQPGFWRGGGRDHGQGEGSARERTGEGVEAEVGSRVGGSGGTEVLGAKRG